MANDVGINFRVDAQTDGLKRAIPDFKAFQDQVSAVLGITDPEVAEAYWQEYNSGLEKSVRIANELSLIQQRNRRAETGENGDAPSGQSRFGGEDDSGRVLTFPSRSILSNARTAAGLLSTSSKDAVGAGLQAGESIIEKGISALGSLSTAAKIAVGAGAGIVGVGLVGNALSKQYEAVVPPLVEATAALKRFGDTADDQSKKFRTTMNDVSETSTKYGYSLEQGLSLITQAARGGAGAGRVGDAYQAQITGVMEKVMNASIALGMTTPSSQLADIAILGSRFRQGNALDIALGGANNVFGSQRAEETATALATMFEDVLGQGVEASLKELGATQNWLYRVFGERAAGAGGANIFAGLSGAVRGSTSLSNETDILKYQAARNLTGGNPLEAFMKLEEGFSVDMFKSFQDLVSGASEWDKMFLTSKAFGINLTTAKKMWDAAPGTGKEYYESLIAGGGESMTGTPEIGTRSVQERIANEIRTVGAEAFQIKYAVLKGTDRVIQAILHPESVDYPMVVPNSKGNIKTNIAESSGAFGSIITAGNPYAGYEGDPLASREWVIGRYGQSDSAINKGLNDLKFLTDFFHNDVLMEKATPAMLERWNKYNTDIDPKTDWSSRELAALIGDIKKTFPGVMDMTANDTIFRSLEPSYRAALKTTPTGETRDGDLWRRANELMGATRDKFAQLPESERNEFFGIEMRDKKPGFSESELSAVVKLLEQIAKYTGDFTKMDLTISPDLFK